VNFTDKFLGAMGNTPGSFSLRKWLSVGLFWLVSYVTIKNTNEQNIEMVLTILTPCMVTMAGIYSYFNNKDKKLDLEKKEEPARPQP